FILSANCSAFSPPFFLLGMVPPQICNAPLEFGLGSRITALEPSCRRWLFQCGESAFADGIHHCFNGGFWSRAIVGVVELCPSGIERNTVAHEATQAREILGRGLNDQRITAALVTIFMRGIFP